MLKMKWYEHNSIDVIENALFSNISASHKGVGTNIESKLGHFSSDFPGRSLSSRRREHSQLRSHTLMFMVV